MSDVDDALAATDRIGSYKQPTVGEWAAIRLAEEVRTLRARVGVLERDNDDLFEKWKSASAFYFVANCGNCDEDVYNGPCISTLEHNGRMVIPFDMGSGQASFSCGRCGADNYTGDVEMFTEGGRDDIDDDDDPDSDGEVSS